MKNKLFCEIQAKDGLDMVLEETTNFDRIVKGVYDLTARDIYGSIETPGLAVFAYGSPGRIELIGGDSDADIFLAEKETSKETQRFRELFKKRLESFDFSKVDLTEWGNYKEINAYLNKSLVEGNQVLETRYLCGDISVRDDVEQFKKEYNSIERGIKNIIFNRLYFNQYYRQRVRGNALNIKYCHGGSRDFLFVYWHDRVDRMLANDIEDLTYRPRVIVGLERLLDNGKISEKDFSNWWDAISFSMALRSDILRVNKNGPDKGLTFADEKTLLKLNAYGYPAPEVIQKRFEVYRGDISQLVSLIWEETIAKIKFLRGPKFADDLRIAYHHKTPQKIRGMINAENPLLRIALIWGASESQQKELFSSLCEKYIETEDWAAIASLVCSPLCSARVLHRFGTGILKEEGYGYILRIVARNKNISKDTLKSIAENTKLEKRYTEVAKAALIGGNSSANNQI